MKVFETWTYLLNIQHWESLIGTTASSSIWSFLSSRYIWRFLSIQGTQIQSIKVPTKRFVVFDIDVFVCFFSRHSSNIQLGGRRAIATPGYATDVAPTDLARAEGKFDPRLTVGMAAVIWGVWCGFQTSGWCFPSHNGFDFRSFEQNYLRINVSELRLVFLWCF